MTLPKCCGAECVLLERAMVVLGCSRKDALKMLGSTERGPSPGSVEIPETLRTPEFLEVWDKWLEHLDEKRKKPTTHAKELQLRKLAKVGPATAVLWVEHSMANNWQGIYPPKDEQVHVTADDEISRRNWATMEAERKRGGA